MEYVKEQAREYRDNQIRFRVNDSVTFEVSFQNGELLLSRIGDWDYCEPVTNFLISLDVPKDIQIDQGAYVRWFYNTEMLYMSFCRFPEGGCYAVNYTLGPPRVVEQLSKVQYNIRAADHDAKVDSRKFEERLRELDTVICQREAQLISERKSHELELRRINEKHQREMKMREQHFANELLISRRHLEDHCSYLSVLKECRLSMDFAFVCNDGERLIAHRAVLTCFWPLFTTLGVNEMPLDCSSEIGQLMIEYLYGSKIEFTHTQALPLMQLAATHGFSGLDQMALEKLKKFKRKLNLKKCLKGWRWARKHLHEEAKDFYSRLISRKFKGKGRKRTRGDFETISRNEALELFLAVAK